MGRRTRSTQTEWRNGPAPGLVQCRWCRLYMSGPARDLHEFGCLDELRHEVLDRLTVAAELLRGRNRGV